MEGGKPVSGPEALTEMPKAFPEGFTTEGGLSQTGDEARDNAALQADREARAQAATQAQVNPPKPAEPQGEPTAPDRDPPTPDSSGKKIGPGGDRVVDRG